MIYLALKNGGAMGLVKCKECGKDISEKAEQCPACGAPTAMGEKKRGGAFAVFVALFTLFSLCMPMILSQALIPIAILLSLIALARKRYLVGLICLGLSVVGMSSVMEKQEQIRKSIDNLKNIR